MATRSRRTAAEIAQLLIANVDSDESGSDDETENGLAYDPSPAVSDEEESTDESEDPFERVSVRRNAEAREMQFTSSDGTHWTRVDIGSVTDRGRAPARNIIRQRSGATRFILNRVDNEEDIFIELLGHDNILRILDFTRAEANRQGNHEFEISKNDLFAFFGLCIIRGVLQGKNEPLSSFWSQDFGINVFKETMSRNRFKDIKRYLRFDDKTTRSERRQTNKFAAIQELWESAMKRCGDAFFPGQHTTVDEQLFPCKCRCPFLQYISAKPDKFGIKFWLICDVDNKYVLNAVPYTGKDEQRDPRVSVPESVVMNLTKAYTNSGISVTTDNFFTSSSLAKNLSQRNITLLGTIRQNRREIPREVAQCLASKHIPVHSSAFFKSGNQMLAAYKVKTTKTVLVLSTEHRSAKVDENHPKKKPEIITKYNNTKYGVDISDQMLRLYSTKCASRRWPLAVFFNLLDIVCLNSWILANEMNMRSARTRREFLLHIGKLFCSKAPSRKRPPHFNISTLRCQALQSGSSEERTRCQTCKANKTKVTCCSCHKFVCGKCSSPLCNSCSSS